MIRKITLALTCIIGISTSGIAQKNSDLPWQIEAENINPDHYFGVTVANGMIGIVSSPEPLKIKDVVLNGAYDTYGRGRVSNILKGFNFANMDLDVDGNRISSSNISNFRQTLDIHKAELLVSFEVGDKVIVRYKLLALRHLPYSAMIDLEVQAKKDVVITPASVITAPEILQDVRNYYAVIDRPHVKIPLLTSVGNSPTGKHTIAASNTFIFDNNTDIPRLIHEDWDYNKHLLKFDKKLKAGETFRFAVVGSVCSTAQYGDPFNEAERLTIFAMLQGRKKLLRQHELAWQQLWQSDISIDGDPQTQKDIRFMLYHLYSFAREGTAYSLSPMGLSGLGYNGHVFWDTELWMYPPLLMLHPEIARSLLEYRYKMLAAAKQNAFAHGFKGAMYPWESSDDGQESTPVWALTGPYQHHITGDVGWAFWKYYQVTKDKQWLDNRGYPVLKEVADFWVSRVEKDDQGKYHINNVVAADEYAENVDDNAFTNGIAAVCLQYATEAAGVLGLEADPRWMEVANNIVIHHFPDGTTKEYATYNGETIKQADVNLLAYPLKYVKDPVAIRKDLDYYENVMDPGGPAMGMAVLAILHERMGDPEKALELFKKGYERNKVPPFGVLAETAGGTNPYFATGAGGMLQAMLTGFGGLDITDEGIIQLDTKLPNNWKSITITGAGPDRKTYKVK